jgi:L-alanine-DL-glutamate epimerase-like enolase superfamily enzyme
MRITQVDTVYWKDRRNISWGPNWTWVRLHTNNGLVGIGETYPRNAVEAAAIHAVAPTLLRSDPRDIDRIWLDLYKTFDVQVTGGAEMRALSAIDLALWDLLGKSLKVPVYQLLGGMSNPRVRLYNTCFGYKYDFKNQHRHLAEATSIQLHRRQWLITQSQDASRSTSPTSSTEGRTSTGLRPGIGFSSSTQLLSPPSFATPVST